MKYHSTCAVSPQFSFCPFNANVSIANGMGEKLDEVGL